MPNQHKHPPISFRPPAADRSWLLAYAEDQGLSVNLVLTMALEQYRVKMSLAKFQAERASTATIPERKD